VKLRFEYLRFPEFIIHLWAILTLEISLVSVVYSWYQVQETTDRWGSTTPCHLHEMNIPYFRTQ